MAIPTNKDIKQVTYNGTIIPIVNKAQPIEISTNAGMTAVLTSANVGKVYKFTGTTGTYTNGDLYIVENV